MKTGKRCSQHRLPLTRLNRSQVMSQSITTTRQTKAGSIDRTINISADHEPWGRTVYATVLEAKQLKTKSNRTCDCYRLERIRCDIGGLAVLVTKQDGTQHHVHLDATIGDSCSCEAGTYRGACRHLDVVRLAVDLI